MQSYPEKLTGPYAAVLIFLCLAALFSGQFNRDLWTPDEPRVAAISLEMSRTGDIVIPHLAEKNRSGEGRRPGLFYLAGLSVFILVSGYWAILLRIRGGEALWHEWFWVNQVGRLTGNAVAKGHIRTGHPFYYLVQTAADTMPWFPLVLLWAGIFLKNIINFNPVSKRDLFLFTWAAGILALLSFSATKRGIYMAPLLSAFALMGAAALRAHGHKYGLSMIPSIPHGKLRMRPAPEIQSTPGAYFGSPAKLNKDKGL